MLRPRLNSYFEVPTELPSPTSSPQLVCVCVFFALHLGFKVEGRHEQARTGCYRGYRPEVRIAAELWGFVLSAHT